MFMIKQVEPVLILKMNMAAAMERETQRSPS